MKTKALILLSVLALAACDANVYGEDYKYLANPMFSLTKDLKS